VNSIELSQEVRRLRSECAGVEAVEETPGAKLGKHALHLAVDMFGVAECALPLADTHPAETTRPRKNILE
jgi:hypothetical protein